MPDKLAWWLSFAESRAACVVETRAGADVLEALTIAWGRGCAGRGEIRATFLPSGEMKRGVPRRFWYRLRSVPEWRTCGVDAVIDAVPPGVDPCPFCLAAGEDGPDTVH